ncbi:MAG: RNA methyltransferase [Planctomycetales bacterium]|nr:RNA methyltransferase [Planctomycetales bacterium]NIM08069.1 RNA methyltransferase [Planctomycetales bacterium]NIN07560.1 RNA methyltransferase [Planctomycetales bacterium]NIN76667.1 RNA methyltransferase [Planctomycetales bacterium]NIO33855.1 RNA methyltransferase [Planctomycetales bacterium]
MRRRTIHSPQNARIKAAARLRRGAHRARQGKTLIDGIRELNRALDAGVAIEEAFYCPDSGEIEQIGELLRRLDSTRCQVFPVRPEVLAKLAYGQRAEGPVGVAVPPQTRLHDLQLPPNPLVAVLEGVEKPGNLGAIIRTAEAAGLAAVVVADPRTDLYNPNTIRASLGTVFRMPLCTAKTDELLPWLQAAGMQICAARVDGQRLYTELDFSGPTALLLGAEATGLSDAWPAAEVVSIQIPMCGISDSLNVAATAAVLFYEAHRQRSGREP